MSIIRSISEAVSTTATRPFDEPLVIRFPWDEWVALVHEVQLAEMLRYEVRTDFAQRFSVDQPIEVRVWAGVVRLEPG